MSPRAQKVPGTKYLRKTQPRAITNLYGEIKVFCGSASQELGHEICSYLSVEPGNYTRILFSNENIFIKLEESVRGQDVYLVQSLSTPVSDNIMELLIMIDTLKRDSAGRITVVIPYLAYARSDKKDQPRVPITARLIADMIETAGADRYITIDLHSGQIQGFFKIPGDVLTAFYLLGDHLKEHEIKDPVVSTTDLGFAKRARTYFASRLGCPLAFVEKRRTDNKERPELLSLIGDVNGKNVLLVDDEVNTAGSVVNAVDTLRLFGANDIYLAFTHPILNEQAFERLAQLDLKEIVTTNTVHIPPEQILPNMTVLSVAPLLAEVIIRAHEGQSVGALFDE
jgi:ribose-phosphate pyrophosphokinase